MSNEPSFYWHDYETFGIDPRRDWPSQFAGIRTNMDLDIIGEPLMIYCQPNADCLPHPEACLLTRISPLRALKEGLKEKDFIARIYQEMSQPNTCSVGYNSIRFDDEVTRHALYRNFYDPYQREYANNNSRWDIIDLVRMTHALRPEGIHWPKNDQGLTSFRLELLTKANGIGHEAAHDALSDVLATIEMAKLIKQHQPRLFQFYLDLRQKTEAFKLLHKAYQEPLMHVSSKYPTSQNCLAIVMALCPEPNNKNGVVVCDLSKDPRQLLELDADRLREKLYTRNEDLAEGEQRPPFKTVHANKSPALAPMSTLRDEDRQRLGLDLDNISNNQSFIEAHKVEIKNKITDVLSKNHFKQATDPDLMLYGGGFFSNPDKNKMQKLIVMDGKALSEAQDNMNFQDKRIAEMLFRYRARNFPESLRNEEQQRWQAFCASKLRGEQASSSLSLEEFNESIKALKSACENETDKLQLLNDLEAYGKLVADKVS